MKNHGIREVSGAELDDLIDPGISRIRKTWTKLGSKKLRAGPYGKQTLLEEIYKVYSGWREDDWAKGIWARLARRGAEESIDPGAHPLEVLIKLAIPEINPNVVTIWVKAIRCGDDHHVRPFKLRAFFHALGGLVDCARLYDQDQRDRREAEENARLDAEERQAEIKQARRRRNAPKKPVGNFSLF